jgi:hypothetical protein
MRAASRSAKIVRPAFRPVSELAHSAEVICTGPELAEILGFKDDRRLRQLRQEGMPWVGRGRYPRNLCIQWYGKYMWRSALADRRFCEMHVLQLKEQRLIYRTRILEAEVKRGLGNYLHKTGCRRIWSSDLRKIEQKLDRIAVDICSDPRVLADLDLWGAICKRFDEARDELNEFEQHRTSLFRITKLRSLPLPTDS